MPKKFVVFVSYGVYVDAPDDLNDSTQEGYTYLRQRAVAKLFEHGEAEVMNACDLEYEDVTAEFEEFNNA